MPSIFVGFLFGFLFSDAVGGRGMQSLPEAAVRVQPVPVPAAAGREHQSPEYCSPTLGHAKSTAKWLASKLDTISVVLLKHLWVQEEGARISN